MWSNDRYFQLGHVVKNLMQLFSVWSNREAQKNLFVIGQVLSTWTFSGLACMGQMN